MSLAQAPHKGENGLAGPALVCGLIAVIGSFFLFLHLLTVLCAFPAVLCGLFGWRRAKRVHSGRGKSLWGAGLGVAGVLMTLTMYVDTGDDSVPAVTENAVTQNAVTQNAVTQNAVTQNAVTENSAAVTR
ncbi:hypothetical protein H9Y04_10355 [Streptomyces sp. TRM66268-LWL]|uniref:DUF4190 domain-containing protein n=1 Tax=Streptomyces polyasparticus TaxID=2767826 RepID=A0ABR7SBW7_9ACTN|nr:hypothetical protein [Streptomyces polyasparticus]MBC9712970.1 hypothetical protein [Streptomyces polyasparticus]